MSESASSGGSEGQGDRDPVDFGSDTGPLEWAIAGIGLLLALLMVGALAYAGLTGDQGPPSFRTEVAELEVQDDVALYVVQVTNDGGSGASAVVVRAETPDGEVGEAVIAQLPRGASASVGLLVPAADAATVEFRVVGYLEP